MFNLKFAQLSLSSSQTPSTLSPFTSFGLGPKLQYNSATGQNSASAQRSGDSENQKAGLSSGSLTLGGSRRGSAAPTTLPRYPQPIGSLTNLTEYVDLRSPRKNSLKSDSADVDSEKRTSPTTPTRSNSKAARERQASVPVSPNSNYTFGKKILFQSDNHSRIDSDSTVAPSYPSPISPAPEYASPTTPRFQSLSRRQYSATSPITTGRRGSEPTVRSSNSPFSNSVNRFAEPAANEGDVIEIKQLRSPVALQGEKQEPNNTTQNAETAFPHERSDHAGPVGELNRFRFPSNPSPTTGRQTPEQSQRHLPVSLTTIDTSARQHSAQNSDDIKRQSAATIDDDMKELDWEPPSQWNSGESGRMSPPMAYSVRGLEASLGTRTSVSAASQLASTSATPASPQPLGGRQLDLTAASYDDLIHINEGETPPDAPKSVMYERDGDARSHHGFAQ